MTQTARVLAFAGSTRRESFNRRLAAVAAAAVRDAGLPCTLLELADYPLPLYNGDLEAEQGLPDNARRLKDLFLEHQGLLLVSPEYNSSISPLLKNVIDWVSRDPAKAYPVSPYAGKVASLLAASPGSLGGLRGLVTLRSILGNLGVTVLPAQFTLRQADGAFTGSGELREARDAARVSGVAAELAHFLARLYPDAD